MHNKADLVDERQIELFDALEQLARLDIASHIEIPQLIVVGDQSSGKSSVLEALVRLPFPVSPGLGTKYPIKLILRGRESELLKVNVENSKGSSQTSQEKDRLHKFTQDIQKNGLSSWEGLDELMMPPTTAGTNSNKSYGAVTPGSRISGRFTGNILVIEKHGPDLPILSLIDLPGFFQAKSNDQYQLSPEVVEHMVEKQIKLKRNVVLFVVGANTDIGNQTGVRIFQKAAQEDRGLLDRAIGILTHPDMAGNFYAEAQKLVNGESNKHDLPSKWYIVRNPNKEERNDKPFLVDRDENEQRYFNNAKPAWNGVPDERKGIHALKVALKEALWTRTQDALPRIISQVEEMIAKVDAQVQATDESRADDYGRTIYLSGIAIKFEQLMREAVQGTYNNELCAKYHAVGFTCRECDGFFPVPGKKNYNEDGQKKKLCSNIRGLNMAFAVAMRRFGKTEIITSADNMAYDADSPQSTKEQSNRFPPKETIQEYYEYTKPKCISLKDYEEKVVDIIHSNRGKEPIGDVNPIVYRELFLLESANWEKIATTHISAVWSATETFVNEALAYVCLDQTVFQSLQDKIIKPNLEKLQKEAMRTLQDLLNCRHQGITGFFDSFGDMFTVQEQAKDLAGQLDTLGWDSFRLQGRDDWVPKIRGALNNLISLSTSSLSMEQHIIGLIINGIFSLATQASSEKTTEKGPDEGIEREVNQRHPTEFQNLDAARVMGVVEMYYKTTMIAFVGYVNSLVVESNILQKLPSTIFSLKSMLALDQEKMNEIAAENEDDARKREQNKENLKSLRHILKILKDGLKEKK